MKVEIKAYILVIAACVQGLLILLLTNNNATKFMGEHMMGSEFFYLAAFLLYLLVLSAILILYYVVKYLETEKQSIIKLNNSLEVINALKSQKHDFINHLAVIGGMLQLDKKKESLDYINKICGYVEKAFSISQIKNVELQALLYRKCAIAESKEIKVELSIESDLSNVAMDSIELSKVVFNVMDNAIYELETAKDYPKILTIEMYEEDGCYIIVITNSYPILDPNLYEEIFKQGYTTKEANGEHGHGLAIIRNVIKRNKGKIYVESGQDFGTRFVLSLHKKET
jgi:sensor histidine kinase regulating citrate/malate metabolism